MTETERDRDRNLKLEVVKDLQSRPDSWYLSRYSVAFGTDPRIWEYVSGNIHDPDRHNLYEILSVKRFLGQLDSCGWNASRVRHFIRFYQALKFSGLTGRTRYRLTPVQTFHVANIFGLQDEEGRRLIRNVILFVPRKFSKTTFCAGLALYEILFGDNNAQAYVGANSYTQARICFDEIRNSMLDIDPAERHIKVNRETVFFRDGKRNSKASCLTSNAKTKDGLNASLVIMDEYAQSKSSALKSVLTTSMGVRREPLTVTITTASDVLDGPFYGELAGAMKVLRGEMRNRTLFASLFLPDVDDREDDPMTWYKVQPHIGVTVQEDFYRNEWESAQLSAQNMLDFRTKLLNVFAMNEERTWFTRKGAEALVGRFDIDHLGGRKYDCAVAFDLSVHDDLSAVTYTVYSSDTKKFYSHTDYYIPEGTLAAHPNAEQYRMWASQGYLKVCPGEVIDVKLIAGDIMQRSRKVNIIRIAYDAYKAQDLVSILASVGARDQLASFSQTYGSFNLPVESFEMMAYSTPPRIEINDNPINVWCLTNCKIDEDRLENKKPIKITPNRKIDGAISMLMTIGVMISYERK